MFVNNWNNFIDQAYYNKTPMQMEGAPSGMTMYDFLQSSLDVINELNFLTNKVKKLDFAFNHGFSTTLHFYHKL